MIAEDTEEYPFQSSVDAEIARALPEKKMAARGLYLIVTTTLMFGAFGGIIGWLLSILTPAYYQNAYNSAPSEVWQIAVGLGVTQGLICGVVVGCVVLLSTAWYRSRVKSGILQQIKQR